MEKMLANILFSVIFITLFYFIRNAGCVSLFHASGICCGRRQVVKRKNINRTAIISAVHILKEGDCEHNH